MKHPINFHKPPCKSLLGLRRPIFFFLKSKEKMGIIVMSSWKPFLYILGGLVLYSPCTKGNLYSFFFFLPPSNITQGWGELFLLVYSCVTGSRIRSTAGEPSEAGDGKLNWKNTTIFQTLCLPWLQRSQHKLDDVQTAGNGGFTLLESTQTS